MNQTYTFDNNSNILIDISKYYLAGLPSNYPSGDIFYKTERSNKVFKPERSKNWMGKIGLMYLIDYIYSYALGVDDIFFNTPNGCNNNSGGNPLTG